MFAASHRTRIANRNDPEPGRCRRTDGRKWRCAKLCLPQSKYCQRHINRGRNRSANKPYIRPTNSVSSVDHPIVGPKEINVIPTPPSDPLMIPQQDPVSSNVNLNGTSVEDPTSMNYI